jgi:hypothetical protein
MGRLCAIFDTAKQGCSCSSLTGLPVVGPADPSDYEYRKPRLSAPAAIHFCGVALK